MKKLFFSLTLIAVLAGCTHETTVTDTETEATVVTEIARTSSVNYVCIGMETSARFGACPGCKLDSDRMHAFLKNTFGYTGVLLQSEQATKQNVTQAITQGIRNTPTGGLFILYYSGHGGQEKLNWGTTEPEGADEEDEYLCLYDTYMLDDEIWAFIAQSKCRIFLCFDACHSQTLFRSVKSEIAQEQGLAIPLEDELVRSHGFELEPRAIPQELTDIDMLCWSGCLEKEYSYGSRLGGVMTNAILDEWKSSIRYLDLFNKVRSRVNVEQPGQHPTYTQYGVRFNLFDAFK